MMILNIVIHYDIIYHTMIYCITSCYCTSYYNTLYNSTIMHITLKYILLQFNTVHHYITTKYLHVRKWSRFESFITQPDRRHTKSLLSMRRHKDQHIRLTLIVGNILHILLFSHDRTSIDEENSSIKHILEIIRGKKQNILETYRSPGSFCQGAPHPRDGASQIIVFHWNNLAHILQVACKRPKNHSWLEVWLLQCSLLGSSHSNLFHNFRVISHMVVIIWPKG